MSPRRSGVDVASMLRLIDLTDYIVPHTIRAAAELGVADRLADGPLPVGEIAAAVGADEAALLRALRALACNGIFTETEPGCFGLTPLADLLREDHPSSMRGTVPLMPAELYAWAGYHDTMRTGEPAFPRVHGTPFRRYLAEHPEDARRVEAARRGAGAREARAVADGYPWGGVGTVVDVAGGGGRFLAPLLGAHPGLRGTLVDLPALTAGAGRAFADAGVADRAVVHAADVAADPLPPGADVYLLARTLSALPDDAAAALLRSVRAAMSPGARVLVVDPVRDPAGPGDPHDLFLLVFTGGRVRTRDETEQLLDAADLRSTGVHPTAVVPIVEAQPR